MGEIPLGSATRIVNFRTFFISMSFVENKNLQMKKIRLLYVEDSPFDSDLVNFHFEENAPDFNLEIVGTGEQCFKKLKENEYDILLLDNNLPDINGIDILKQLSAEKVPYPIVLLTLEGDEEGYVEAIRCGASDFIQKSKDYILHLHTDLKQVLESYI